MIGKLKNSFRPQLEALEDRIVPTVTNHMPAGQALDVLSHVQVQSVFLGSSWRSGASSSARRFC